MQPGHVGKPGEDRRARTAGAPKPRDNEPTRSSLGPRALLGQRRGPGRASCRAWRPPRAAPPAAGPAPAGCAGRAARAGRPAARRRPPRRTCQSACLRGRPASPPRTRCGPPPEPCLQAARERVAWPISDGGMRGGRHAPAHAFYARLRLLPAGSQRAAAAPPAVVQAASGCGLGCALGCRCRRGAAAHPGRAASRQ